MMRVGAPAVPRPVNVESSEKSDPLPRILVMAYACEPGKGSEQGVGWNWSLQLARFAEVTVITRANNKDAIDGAVPSHLRSRLRFFYYDLPPYLRILKNKERGLYPYYAAWQLGGYFLAKNLNKSCSFTHAIQLTFGSIWLPVFIHRLPAHFIWGPIGGGEAVPDLFIGQLRGRARVLQRLRTILKRTIAANPVVISPLEKALLVVARTEDTAALIPSRYQGKVTCLLETGTSPEVLDQLAPGSPLPARHELVVLFTGRLVGFKNVEMLLHATARALRRGARLQLRIVGDGPELRNLQLLSSELGIESSVVFTGRVPYEVVKQELKDADIYAFPSLREGGVWSLIEAMCAGLPVVCVETSGMKIITDTESAIRLPPNSREELTDGFADALVELAGSEDRRRELGQKAREKMRREFLWDRKGEAYWRLVEQASSNAPR